MKKDAISHLTIIVNNFNIRNSYVATKLKYRIRHRDITVYHVKGII